MRVTTSSGMTSVVVVSKPPPARLAAGGQWLPSRMKLLTPRSSYWKRFR